MNTMNLDDILESVFQYLAAAKKDNSNTHMNFESWEWPTGVGIYGLFKYYKKGRQICFQLVLNFKKRMNCIDNRVFVCTYSHDYTPIPS